jgi:hypothetical protein
MELHHPAEESKTQSGESCSSYCAAAPKRLLEASRCAALFLICFLSRSEIYPFDEGVATQDQALAHRIDEFRAGYSLARCSPALPAFASPANAHLELSTFT